MAPAPRNQVAPRFSTESPRRIVFFFVDGVGIGANDPHANPLVAARMPNLRALLGGRLPLSGQMEDAGTGPGRMKAVDATLGVAGRPQSGTGQTALLTGHNAAELIGRHFGPWVPTGLRELLARENLFSRALALGRSVEFANAYPSRYFESRFGRIRPGAVPLSARTAGVLRRDEGDVRAGTGIVASIRTDTWRHHVDVGAPSPTPEEAGRTLGRISRDADFTLFAHYDTDLAGHRRDFPAGVAAFELVDRFLGGLLPSLQRETLLVIVSDHGNLEDVRAGHTRNPVPLIAAGPGSERVMDQVVAITDVAACILDLLADIAQAGGDASPQGSVPFSP